MVHHASSCKHPILGAVSTPLLVEQLQLDRGPTLDRTCELCLSCHPQLSGHLFQSLRTIRVPAGKPRAHLRLQRLEGIEHGNQSIRRSSEFGAASVAPQLSDLARRVARSTNTGSPRQIKRRANTALPLSGVSWTHHACPSASNIAKGQSPPSTSLLGSNTFPKFCKDRERHYIKTQRPFGLRLKLWLT